MFIPVDLNRGLRLKHLVLSRQKITRLVRDFPLGSASSNTRVIPMGTAAALCLSPALHFEPENFAVPLSVLVGQNRRPLSAAPSSNYFKFL